MVHFFYSPADLGGGGGGGDYLLPMCRPNRVRKGAKIRNRYNQELHLTQDTNGKVTSHSMGQEVSPFPAGDHSAHIGETGASSAPF